MLLFSIVQEIDLFIEEVPQHRNPAEVGVVVPCQTTVGELASEFGRGVGPWHVHLLGEPTGRKVNHMFMFAMM